MRKKQLTDKLQKRRAAAENAPSVPKAPSTDKGAEEYEDMLSEDMSRREQREEKKRRRKSFYIKPFRFVWLFAVCIWPS